MASPVSRYGLAFGALLLASTCLSRPALAAGSPPPPIMSNVDANGVDLSSGQLQSSQTILSIGSGGAGLNYERSLIGKDYLGTFNGTLNDAGSGMVSVSIGTQSEDFVSNGSGGYAPADHGGSSLVAGAQGLLYTTEDGTVAEFDIRLAGQWPTVASLGRLKRITKPSGEIWTYVYQYVDESTGSGYRLNSVTSNRGYQVHWRGDTQSAESDGINLAVDQCDPAAYSCNVSQPVQDLGRLSRLVTYAVSANSIVVHRPSGGADRTYTLDGQGRVISMSDGSGTWSYVYVTDAAGHLVTTVTDPLGHKSALSSSSASGMPHIYYQWVDRSGDGQQQADELTTFSYDSASGAERLSAITYPEGNKTTFTYDSRGNVTSQSAVPKPGTSAPTLTTTAVYPQPCSNSKTCNKPTSITDPKGNTTDYTYSPDHGGVLTVTQPAQANGVRPQTRYAYQSFYATYWRDGVLQPATSPIWKLVSKSACQTQSSCANTGDELVDGYVWGGNNVDLLYVQKKPGDNTAILTTILRYDTAGNLQTVDGPLPGNGDTTRFYYDAARQRVGTVGPNPNGGGPTKNRAIRYQYDLDGRLVWLEQGTTNDQSDGAMGSFDSIIEQLYERDPQGRLAKSTLLGRFSRTQMTEYGYSANGLLACSTVRMNQATFDSEPPSACNLGVQGNDGPDRLTVYGYDGANQVTSVHEGVGAPDDRYTARYGYTPNGKIASTLDANTNATWYVYDGQDRLLREWHSDKNNGLTQSPTDYTDYAYDNNSNVLYERRRDGTVFQNDWDALNRLKFAYRADDSSTAYTYDNLGQVRSAVSGSKYINNSYDAFGRWYAESDDIGYMVENHDEAGRTWQVYNNIGANTAYSYNAQGDLTGLSDGGGAGLAGLLYDNLGQRALITRPNGVFTFYNFDAISRLTYLTQDLPGSDKDVQIALTYNPAGQIRTRGVNNGAYDYVEGYGVVRPYSNNALNQVTQSGGQAIDYTATGNLRSDGARGITYGYDNVNRLTSATPSGQGTASLTYDPLDRLRSTTPAGGSQTRYRYDGDAIISEHDSYGGVKSYVYGPGVDEPLISYGPAGRQFPIADERGSIIALTNDQGAAVAVNTYDAYGVPGTNNQGRFQYTGQAWLPEAGLYHYKARAYSPTLGKFLQPDPIGIAGGMNLYGYVGADPVNSIDPSGLAKDTESKRINYISGPGGNTVQEVVVSRFNVAGYIRDLAQSSLRDFNTRSGVALGGREGGGGGSDSRGLQSVVQQVIDGLKKLACSIGNVDAGFGADVYDILGASVGGSVKIDLTTGQTGLGGGVAVGVGGGADIGPNVTMSSSGSRPISANVTGSVGVGRGIAVITTRNLIGTDTGGRSTTVGRVGVSAFANVGAAVGLNTPKFYNACGKK